MNNWFDNTPILSKSVPAKPATMVQNTNAYDK